MDQGIQFVEAPIPHGRALLTRAVSLNVKGAVLVALRPAHGDGAFYIKFSQDAAVHRSETEKTSLL